MLLNFTLLLNVALLVYPEHILCRQSSGFQSAKYGFYHRLVARSVNQQRLPGYTGTHPPILTHLTAASTSSSCQLPAGRKGFPNRWFYWRVDVICAIMERTSTRLYKAMVNKQNLGYWSLWDTSRPSKPSNSIGSQWLATREVCPAEGHLWSVRAW